MWSHDAKTRNELQWVKVILLLPSEGLFYISKCGVMIRDYRCAWAPDPRHWGVGLWGDQMKWGQFYVVVGDIKKPFWGKYGSITMTLAYWISFLVFVSCDYIRWQAHPKGGTLTNAHTMSDTYKKVMSGVRPSVLSWFSTLNEKVAGAALQADAAMFFWAEQKAWFV